MRKTATDPLDNLDEDTAASLAGVRKLAKLVGRLLWAAMNDTIEASETAAIELGDEIVRFTLQAQ